MIVLDDTHPPSGADHVALPSEPEPVPLGDDHVLEPVGADPDPAATPCPVVRDVSGRTWRLRRRSHGRELNAILLALVVVIALALIVAAVSAGL